VQFDDDALILSTYITSNGDTSHTFDSRHSRLLANAPALAVRSASKANSIFNVYPEGGELLCKFNASASGGTIELYNSVGMSILSMAVFGGENTKKLDIRDLSSGIYFIRYTSGAANEVRSFNLLR